jgi:nicotinamide riboside transporter PnuC
MTLLGWCGVLLILAGYFFMAKKSISAWVLWFIGNIFMGFYSYIVGANPMVFLSFVLAIMNVYGYMSWKKDSFWK